MTFDKEGRLTVAGWCSRTDLPLRARRHHHDDRIEIRRQKTQQPERYRRAIDGSTYWTDSAGGLVIPGMVAQDVQRYLDVHGVYRLTPDGSEVQLAIADCTYPNGLAFSPDEKLLYVNDSRLALIRVVDVAADGSVGPGRLFHKLTGTEAGVADGMKVDVEGNVYCTGPGGVHVIDASTANCSGVSRSRGIAPTWHGDDDDNARSM